MKIKTVNSQWFADESYRLDCSPYIAGAIEAKQRIKNLDVEKKPLRDLVLSEDGLYKGKMIKRIFVNSYKDGVQFLTTSGMLRFDLRAIPILAKKSANSDPACFIYEGTILISAAGTIGNMAYVRRDMDGIFACGDILKVVPDFKKISPGYLYTYLSSIYGLPQVTQGTYGSIVQHLDPKHIADLSVPIFKRSDEKSINDFMKGAADERSKAKSLLDECRRRVSDLIDFKNASKDITNDAINSIISSKKLIVRLDSYYYSVRNLKLRECITANNGLVCHLGEVSEVFIPNIFKRKYSIEKEFGIPYITGADVFKTSPSSDRYLMKGVVEKNRLKLEKGMIIIQEAGQLGGLIGRSVFVGKHLANFACSNNMIRVTGNDIHDSYYLYVLLSLPEYVELISAEAAGSSIPHIEEKRVKKLLIYWPDKDVRDSISRKVKTAVDLLDKASENETKAYELLDKLVKGA